MNTTRIGIIGCGDISPNYLRHLRLFDFVEVAACADLVAERAEKRALEFGVPKACSVKELLDDPSIEIVANLTTPQAHFDVAMQVVKAGKHVYNEKPLALELDEAKRLLNAAKAKGLRVGCAPDTFLGGGIQTCRKLIDDGAIGEPVAATAFMMCHGHEGWHPDRRSTTRKAAGRCSTWAPTTSRRSRCSSARCGASPAWRASRSRRGRSRASRSTAPSSTSRCRRTSPA
jgi:predicted dehydrogenase